MADPSKYKSVSLGVKTYGKLKDLSASNPHLKLSIASTITYLVNKEHKEQFTELCPYGAGVISRSSSEVKSNDN